jgi:hypothetical protein
VLTWGSIGFMTGAAAGTGIFGIAYGIEWAALFEEQYCDFINENLLQYNCTFNYKSEHGYSNCKFECPPPPSADISLVWKDAHNYAESHASDEINKELPLMTTLPIFISGGLGLLGGVYFGWKKPLPTQSITEDPESPRYRPVSP